MTKGWDWVIGTGLYVAALVLSWLTLFSLERFGAEGVKAWAPLIQAFLSAGAIYSAWWLQTRKRAADRLDDVADNVTHAVESSALFEWDAAQTCRVAANGSWNQTVAKIYGSGLRRHDDLLRKVSLAKLPDPSIRAFLALLQKTDEFAATVEHLATVSPTNTDDLLTLYEDVHRCRDRFLDWVGRDPHPKRIAPKLIHSARESGDWETLDV